MAPSRVRSSARIRRALRSHPRVALAHSACDARQRALRPGPTRGRGSRRFVARSAGRHGHAASRPAIRQRRDRQGPVLSDILAGVLELIRLRDRLCRRRSGRWRGGADTPGAGGQPVRRVDPAHVRAERRAAATSGSASAAGFTARADPRTTCSIRRAGRPRSPASSVTAIAPTAVEAECDRRRPAARPCASPAISRPEVCWS